VKKNNNKTTTFEQGIGGEQYAVLGVKLPHVSDTLTANNKKVHDTCSGIV